MLHCYILLHVSYAMSKKGSTLHSSCYSWPSYVYLSFMLHFEMRISSAVCYSCIFVSTKITPRWSAVLLCSLQSSKILFHLSLLEKTFFLSCNKSFIMVRWDALKQSRSIKCFEKVLKGVGLNWNIWTMECCQEQCWKQTWWMVILTFLHNSSFSSLVRSWILFEQRFSYNLRII